MTTLFEIKRRSRLVAAMLAAFALGTSCTEDLDVMDIRQTDRVSFDVSISDKWNIAKTRSAAQSGRTVSSTKIENSGLWLISSFEDGSKDTVSDLQNIQTRGTQITGDNIFSEYGTFMVNAFLYDKSKEWDAVKETAQTYISNCVVDFNTLVSDHYWPQDDYSLHFIAYAPSMAEGAAFSLSEDRELQVEYEVPSDIKKQTDLLMASPVDANNIDTKQAVNLDFHHILTSVQVRIQPSEFINGIVKKITFQNVVGKGSYKYGNTSWNLEAPDASFSFEPDNLEIPASGSCVSVASGENTFIMIPQTLGDDAEMEIVIERDGVDKLMKVSLAGHQWPMSLSSGNTVIYTLVYDFLLDVALKVNTEEVTYRGGTNTYIVESSKIDSDGNIIGNAEWTVDEDSCSLPTWVEWKKDNEGNLEITLEPVALTNEINHDEELKNNTSVSGYDLSTNGGNDQMNTANCYIVNAPGSYKLPLVYGNAIKNGVENVVSYDSPIETTTFPQITHTGTSIIDPYIYNNMDSENNKYKPEDATLVWMDTKDGVSGTYDLISSDKGLVKNVRLDDEKKYLLFDVDENIYQGNAMVAVRDAKGTIMWSWHIWVTDYVPNGSVSIDRNHDPAVLNHDRVVTNAKDMKYTFMPVHIGWVYTKDELYAERSFTIRIKQVETGKFIDLEVTQPGDRYIEGYCPYYQMGRKDPLLPAEPKENKFRHYQITDEKYVLLEDGNHLKHKTPHNEAGSHDYRFSIHEPHIFVSGQGLVSFGGKTIYNMWNNYCNTELIDIYKPEYVIKTVDDPSPKGYCVPPSSVYNGFMVDANSGSNKFEEKKTNSYFITPDEHISHRGSILYCSNITASGVPDPSAGVIYFPIRGEITHNTAQVMNIREKTQTNNATGVLTSNETPTVQLVFYSWPKRGIFFSGERHGRGFPVRSIREEGDILPPSVR